MALIDFIKKQLVTDIRWDETDDPLLAWQFPMEGREVPVGAVLAVREGQRAVVMCDGVLADVFGPGHYKLGARSLPVLTSLRHAAKDADGALRCDVVFISTRSHADQRWGTRQPVLLNASTGQGALRLRAFGSLGYRVIEPRRFITEVLGPRSVCRTGDIEGQMRALIVRRLPDAIAGLDAASLNQAVQLDDFGHRLREVLQPACADLGLQLDQITIESISLPDQPARALDPALGSGVVRAGAMAHRVAFGGAALGAAANADQHLRSLVPSLADASPVVLPVPSSPLAVRLGEAMATLQRMTELKAAGSLSEAEFEVQKAALLRSLA